MDFVSKAGRKHFIGDADVQMIFDDLSRLDSMVRSFGAFADSQAYSEALNRVKALRLEAESALAGGAELKGVQCQVLRQTYQLAWDIYDYPTAS